MNMLMILKEILAMVLAAIIHASLFYYWKRTKYNNMKKWEKEHLKEWAKYFSWLIFLCYIPIAITTMLAIASIFE